MEYFDRLLAIMRRHAHLGERRFVGGGIRIGHVPDRGPLMLLYVHGLFAPLTDDGLSRLETVIGRSIPAPLKAFYRRTNGLSLFMGSLSIDGLRTSWARNDDDAMWSNPYDLARGNVHERTEGIDPAWLTIGGYGFDGTDLYMDERTGEIWRTERWGTRRLNHWASLGDMLVAEAERIAPLFGESGHRLVPGQATVPDPNPTLEQPESAAPQPQKSNGRKRRQRGSEPRSPG